MKKDYINEAIFLEGTNACFVGNSFAVYNFELSLWYSASTRNAEETEEEHSARLL